MNEDEENWYDDDSPCQYCNETDYWECACCSRYADYIGDDDFDPMDI